MRLFFSAKITINEDNAPLINVTKEIYDIMGSILIINRINETGNVIIEYMVWAMLIDIII